MQKDVIYVDVEDDITAIIGKVKASKEKVVALVPPKRIGVLQSAVNLRLLSRIAKQSDKKLVLVTNNQALLALATAAAIPVARTLQSKPELADIPALEIDDGEDVIDGGTLPVGDHAAQQKNTTSLDESKSDAMATALAAAPAAGELPKKPKAKSGPKVPNFNRFRKRLVLMIGGGVFLVGFMVWALFFAARATVIISAQTSSSSINQQVAISASGATNLASSTIKATEQTQQDDKTIEFNATGKKDVGKQATGTVQFSTSSLGGLGTIPAGTKLTTSGGLVFVTDSAVTLSFQGGPSSSGTTTVTAAENGSKYNAASGNLSGAPNDVSASFTEPTSGGVTKMVSVVTAADVQKAKTALSEANTDSIKTALSGKFGEDALVLDESFSVDYGDVKSTPEVGAEAEKSTLSARVTYHLYAVERAELGKYLDAYMKKELNGKADQRVYDNGSEKANFQEATRANGGARATLIATAQVGPQINDSNVKQSVKGKRLGEIQQNLEAVQGVNSVDVKFFPFWVSTVPEDDSRITIEFKLDESQ